MGKKIRRFFVPPQDIRQGEAIIRGAEAHHARSVVRLGTGDAVVIFDGRGNEYSAVIESMDADRILLSLEARQHSENTSIFDLCLAQGYLKDKKMDFLIRHLVELGVSRWLPFWAKRSVPSPDERRLKARIGRWQTIAQEALKQSQRNQSITIDAPVSFEDALQSARAYDLKLMCWEETRSAFAPSVEQASKPTRIFIMIGPEGGFEKSEADMALEHGFQVMGLGPRVLRAETAALAACSLIQYLYGDMGPA
jgi:16S rRNA (uracil1498-N3)-methyltransferase